MTGPSRSTRVLLITFYYPPDLCAGSFRAEALLEGLDRVGSGSVHVDVLTTSPNRYQTYVSEAPAFERFGPHSVRRISVGVHSSGMLDQSMAFGRFAAGVVRHASSGPWDLVVATSSRLMTGALGALVASRLDVPLYLDVRDLFPDTMSNVLSRRLTPFMLPVLRRIESTTVHAASRVNVVSAGFLPDMRRIAPCHEYRVFTNGIDEAFADAGRVDATGPRSERPLVLYAGNIGEGQGLHDTIPRAARCLSGRVRFRIIGDGGRRRQLARSVEEMGLTNVELVDPVSRSTLIEHYRSADILFLQLNDYPAFRKVLPSKIFEYAAMGKPILAGVSGFAAEFIRREVPGAYVFDPGDVEGLLSGVDMLRSIGPHVDRAEFRARFGRSDIMSRMAKDILDCAARST